MPSVSVVIAAYRSRSTIEACLHSLERQIQKPLEIILVVSGEDGTEDLVTHKYPSVRLFAFSDRKHPGDARNVGVRYAEGDVIAFLDADAVADSDWVQEISLAHQGPEAAIGGAIGNGNPESSVSWAAYFCEFSQWMPGGKERSMADVPTVSLSLKRWAFEKYGPFLEGTYCSDTAFNWRAGVDGHLPLFRPSIRILHVNITKLSRFLSKQVMHGRAFATVRIKERRLLARNTAILALGSPLLPFLLFLRILGRVLQNRQYLRRFVTASLLVFIGLAAWSWGECTGYWSSLCTVRAAKVPESVEPSA